jgi:hypothetical protein
MSTSILMSVFLTIGVMRQMTREDARHISENTSPRKERVLEQVQGTRACSGEH